MSPPKYGRIEGQVYDPEEARPIKWLWKYKLAKGTLNILVGDGGVGKSTLVAHLLAGITNGKLPYYPLRGPLRVGIVAQEDNWLEIWSPRLTAAGASKVPGRVHRILTNDFGQVVITPDSPDLQNLMDYFVDNRIKVVYFDQLLDHLGNINTYSQGEVRNALTPIRAMAEATGITFLATMHPNKRADSFAQLMSGSGAFRNMARSILYVAPHPEDENIRVVTVEKNNYAPPGEQAYEFNIDGYSYRTKNGRIETNRVRSLEKTNMTVEELMKIKPMRERPISEAITDAIEHYLEGGEWLPRSVLIEELQYSGFSERTVKRVAKSMGVQYKTDGFQGPGLWQLPKPETNTGDKLKARR